MRNHAGDVGAERLPILSQRAVVAVGSIMAMALVLGWDAVAFRMVAHLFYEQSALAALRERSQVALVHYLAMFWLAFPVSLVMFWRQFGPDGRRWLMIMAAAYAIRAAIWVAGSNLPLVPGDSCHYVEVASSILQGQGPVKHYVESFFRDYPAIRRNEGVLDDWATPLYSYLLAGSYRALAVTPGESLEGTFAVGKGLSFVLNLATLPALYYFTRHSYGSKTALRSMAVLAVLPVHALYAGLELRESLVALMTLVAVGTFVKMDGQSKARILWAIASGLFTGLAILSRNTALATAAACGLYGVFIGRGRNLGQLLIWSVAVILLISLWALATYREYGQPFYTYTQYFAYNFSWTVHHYEQGNTRPSEFFTSANAPEIIRTKAKAILIIGLYSTMIVSLPLAVGCLRRFITGSNPWDRLTALIALAFVAGTMVGTADVTQVMQLGRYYLPLFVLMIPSAVAGLDGHLSCPGARRILVGWSIVALLWADPTWAYDFSWLTKTYQLHWPSLQAAGQWVRAHPDAVPPNARIVTWFPWEFRLASRRPTILLNRSLYPAHIERTIRNYQATHLLWGSFEPPPDIDPELWATHLARIRSSLGLNPGGELYRSPVRSPIGSYPVTLYRIGRDSRQVPGIRPASPAS